MDSEDRSDNVDAFLARVPARAVKLAPWLNDIAALRNHGVSYRMICRYLAEHGIQADVSEVHRFMHRCGRQRLLATPPVQAKVAPAAPTAGTLPKFDWSPSKDETPKW